MLKRRRRWLLVPLVLFAVVAGLCVAFEKSPYVTQAQIDQVKAGMTPKEVQALFGRPPDYEGMVLDQWEAWTGTAIVLRDEERKATLAWCREKDLIPLRTARLRRKLGW